MTLQNKLKQIKTILKSDDTILITINGGKMKVEGCNKTPSEIKDIATLFFKTAYKIDKPS